MDLGFIRVDSVQKKLRGFDGSPFALFKSTSQFDGGISHWFHASLTTTSIGHRSASHKFLRPSILLDSARLNPELAAPGKSPHLFWGRLKVRILAGGWRSRCHL